MDYPAIQMEFQDYIFHIRWPKGFESPNCGSILFWKKNKGRYECKGCQKETSVTNGTIFHKSTKLLSVWLRAIWWIVAQKNGVSTKGLQKILGLGSYQTSWVWLHKFRRLMVMNGRSKLKGIVEVLIGGKKPGTGGGRHRREEPHHSGC